MRSRAAANVGSARRREGAKLQRYQLAQVYATLRAAVRRADWPAASRELATALGVAWPNQPDPNDIRQAAAHRLEPQLTYRGFKPAELAMWRAAVKNLVKFEDVPLAEAHRFAAAAAPQAAVDISRPYRKDYLLLRSAPTHDRDPRALATVYASRDGAAKALHRLEAAGQEDPRRAGALLEIPSCCVAAFAEDFERARRDQDTLNDDACRRLLQGAAAENPGDFRLNPLSNWELLGFYPCSPRCQAAIARADAVLAALDPVDAARARQVLRRPAVYLRLPFFWVDCASDAASPQWRANSFDDPLARTVQALFAAHLGEGPPLAALAAWQQRAGAHSDAPAALLAVWR